MTRTAVVECGNCKGLLLAVATQKSRTCPYCGTKLQLQKAKRLAIVQNAFEASELLRKLKAENRDNKRTTKRKPAKST